MQDKIILTTLPSIYSKTLDKRCDGRHLVFTKNCRAYGRISRNTWKFPFTAHGHDQKNDRGCQNSTGHRTKNLERKNLGFVMIKSLLLCGI